MTVFGRVRMASLGGATGWLNSEPLGPAELRGHVVHTPEFSFEHEIDGVRQATNERAIHHPVAVDNEHEIWSAFANHYWPALYFIDTDGTIRDHHFGEGRYEQSERVIQRLLGVDRELVSVEARGVEAEADWDHLETPETYLGYARSQQFASPDAAGFDERRTYGLPERLRLNRRRRRQRLAPGRPPVPTPAGARHGARADAGDHLPRARRRGVRVHVRVTPHAGVPRQPPPHRQLVGRRLLTSSRRDRKPASDS
jgi:hypothetical protein